MDTQIGKLDPVRDHGNMVRSCQTPGLLQPLQAFVDYPFAITDEELIRCTGELDPDNPISKWEVRDLNDYQNTRCFDGITEAIEDYRYAIFIKILELDNHHPPYRMTESKSQASVPKHELTEIEFQAFLVEFGMTESEFQAFLDECNMTEPAEQVFLAELNCQSLMD